MIRQAHSYLVGALSGATLIGIAIAVFVVLVSAQVFHDWPIVALSSHNDQSSVAPAKALTRAGQTAEAAPTGTAAPTAHPSAAKADAATPAPTAGHARHHRHASTDATGPATVVEAAPEPIAAGDETSTGAESGSQSSSPSSSSTNSTSLAPSSSPAPSSGGSTGSSGASASSSSGSGTKTGGSTGNSTSTTTTPPPTTVPKPSQAITETVNGTVGAVNEVTGGALSEAGVTRVTEEVVNGVVGPESLVGKTVDGVGESLNRLLGGGEG